MVVEIISLQPWYVKDLSGQGNSRPGNKVTDLGVYANISQQRSQLLFKRGQANDGGIWCSFKSQFCHEESQAWI